MFCNHQRESRAVERGRDHAQSSSSSAPVSPSSAPPPQRNTAEQCESQRARRKQRLAVAKERWRNERLERLARRDSLRGGGERGEERTMSCGDVDDNEEYDSDSRASGVLLKKKRSMPLVPLSSDLHAPVSVSSSSFSSSSSSSSSSLSVQGIKSPKAATHLIFNTDIPLTDYDLPPSPTTTHTVTGTVPKGKVKNKGKTVPSECTASEMDNVRLPSHELLSSEPDRLAKKSKGTEVDRGSVCATGEMIPLGKKALPSNTATAAGDDNQEVAASATHTHADRDQDIPKLNGQEMAGDFVAADAGDVRVTKPSKRRRSETAAMTLPPPVSPQPVFDISEADTRAEKGVVVEMEVGTPWIDSPKQSAQKRRRESVVVIEGEVEGDVVVIETPSSSNVCVVDMTLPVKEGDESLKRVRGGKGRVKEGSASAPTSLPFKSIMIGRKGEIRRDCRKKGVPDAVLKPSKPPLKIIAGRRIEKEMAEKEIADNLIKIAALKAKEGPVTSIKGVHVEPSVAEGKDEHEKGCSMDETVKGNRLKMKLDEPVRPDSAGGKKKKEMLSCESESKSIESVKVEEGSARKSLKAKNGRTVEMEKYEMNIERQTSDRKEGALRSDAKNTMRSQRVDWGMANIVAAVVRSEENSREKTTEISGGASISSSKKEVEGCSLHEIQVRDIAICQIYQLDENTRNKASKTNSVTKKDKDRSKEKDSGKVNLGEGEKKEKEKGSFKEQYKMESKREKEGKCAPTDSEKSHPDPGPDFGIGSGSRPRTRSRPGSEVPLFREDFSFEESPHYSDGLSKVLFPSDSATDEIRNTDSRKDVISAPAEGLNKRQSEGKKSVSSFPSTVDASKTQNNSDMKNTAIINRDDIALAKEGSRASTAIGNTGNPNITAASSSGGTKQLQSSGKTVRTRGEGENDIHSSSQGRGHGDSVGVLTSSGTRKGPSTDSHTNNYGNTNTYSKTGSSNSTTEDTTNVHSSNSNTNRSGDRGAKDETSGRKREQHDRGWGAAASRSSNSSNPTSTSSLYSYDGVDRGAKDGNDLKGEFFKPSKDIKLFSTPSAVWEHKEHPTHRHLKEGFRKRDSTGGTGSQVSGVGSGSGANGTNLPHQPTPQGDPSALTSNTPRPFPPKPFDPKELVYPVESTHTHF